MAKVKPSANEAIAAVQSILTQLEPLQKNKDNYVATIAQYQQSLADVQLQIDTLMAQLKVASVDLSDTLNAPVTP